MNFNIYSKYKVHIKSKLSLKDYENDFREEIYNICHEIDGGKLLEIISKKINDHWISEVKFDNNEIVFIYFNPMTGEGSADIYKIEEVKGE